MIFNKPSMMRYVDIKIMILILVDNKCCSLWISHVIKEMLSIINIISCNMPIDDVYYQLIFVFAFMLVLVHVR